MRNNRTMQERKKILEEYHHSNLSGAAFCRERKIALPSFYKWSREEKLKEGKEKLNFVSLSVEECQEKITPIKKQKKEGIILKTKEGIFLKLPISITTSWISSLLKDLS